MSLCDDYSLPVDFVNKQRALSGCEPSIELLDTYCDPRDSKAYLVPGEEATTKVYTSPDREYTHPYAGESSESEQSPAKNDSSMRYRFDIDKFIDTGYRIDGDMFPKSSNQCRFDVETTIFVFDLAKKSSCYRHRQHIDPNGIETMSNRQHIGQNGIETMWNRQTISGWAAHRAPKRKPRGDSSMRIVCFLDENLEKT